MKLPVVPPPFDKLLRQPPDEILKVFSARASAAPGGVYRHWDKLRHLAPPDGLTAEQWWFAVKQARRNNYRTTPLRDAQGQPFVYCMPDPLLASLHRIDSRASGRISAPAEVTNEDTRDRFLISSLIEEAITSSQLEGASTTRQVAARMLRENRAPRDKSEQMILNNFNAMKAIIALGEAPMSVDSLLRLHEMLTESTLDDPHAAGRFQTAAEERVRVVDNRDGVTLHMPPPAAEIPQRMERLVEFANASDDASGFVHPLVRAIILHFWLAYDHPFVDGNGRVARALFYWSAARSGYWLLEYVSISRVLARAPARYARSFLYTESDENDLTYFLIEQVAVIERGLASLELFLRRKSEQVQQVSTLIRSRSELNHRQIALLSHAVRHPGHRYTIRSHQTSHRVAYATARADLQRLAELDLLEMHRINQKTFGFVAPHDVMARLEAMAGAG
jgi:Fic family protein